MAKRRLHHQGSPLRSEVRHMILLMRPLRQLQPPKRRHHPSPDDLRPLFAWSVNRVRYPNKVMHPHRPLQIVRPRHSPTTVPNLSLIAVTRPMQVWHATNSTPSTTACLPGPLRTRAAQTVQAFDLGRTAAASVRLHLLHHHRGATLLAPLHLSLETRHLLHGNMRLRCHIDHRSHLHKHQLRSPQQFNASS